jgi:hypothetical protein
LELLVTNDPDTSMMKAEIPRELGQFGECLGELCQAFDDAHLRVVEAIKGLAESGKRRVERIE